MYRISVDRIAIALLLLAGMSGFATAQSLVLSSPLRNQQICLGNAVAVTASAHNLDTIMRSLVVRLQITNVVTGVTVYEAADTALNVAPNAIVEAALPNYVTETGKLSELGTFEVVASLSALDSALRPLPSWPFGSTTRFHVFGMHTVPNPFADFGLDYSRSLEDSVDFPNQLLWANIGATIVEGDSAVWEAPPPEDDVSGFGPDSLHSPTFRLDRIASSGIPYAGTSVGDTLMSFPINLASLPKTQLTFDFMRGGRAHYPTFWETKELTGPESPITDVNGRLLVAGDSLLLEFASPSSSPCDTGAVSWRKVLGIAGGHDLSFHTAYITIEPARISAHFGDSTSTTVTDVSENYLTAQFRFRFRLKASDHGGSSVREDADPFFIDNIHVQRLSLPEVEVMWGRVVTPYTVLPFSATAALPVYVKLKSYGAAGAMNVPVRVTITARTGQICYDATSSFPRLPASQDTIVRMPDWDARSAPMPEEYYVVTRIASPGFDSYSLDDVMHTAFFLNAGMHSPSLPEGRGQMAYDDAGGSPPDGAGNDIPFLTSQTGDGIGFNNSSGSYAVKHTLPQRDTIYGALIYFGSANASPDAIRISLHSDDSAALVPGDTLRQESTQTSFEDFRRGGSFNQFWPYYFPKPIVVDSGSYWIAVSQLSLDNMMMGGDIPRGGATMIVGDVLQPKLHAIYNDPYGSQWSALDNNGDVSQSFAVESPVGAGWHPWMPSSGFWPVSSSREALPITPRLGSPQSAGGAYLPMIRLIVGQASRLSAPRQTSSREALQVYPNPAPAGAGPLTFILALARATHGSLTIYNVMGKIIRHLPARTFAQGSDSVTWDGTDDRGSAVAAGSYVLRFADDCSSYSTHFTVIR